MRVLVLSSSLLEKTFDASTIECLIAIPDAFSSKEEFLACGTEALEDFWEALPALRS